MRITHFLIFALATAGIVTPTSAQTITTLIQFTNVWRYNLSGLDLAPLWRTNTFNDSSWPSGPGLLGAEEFLDPYKVHVPSGIGTPFPLPLSQTVTTYFFRTTFFNPNNPNTPGLTLIASNLVDDGCAIWLNGRLAGTVRLPAGFNNTTLAIGGATEGDINALTLTNLLRIGVNSIAVEVHQASPVSGDIMFGMRLLTFIPMPLVITNQPANLIISAGDTATFQVGVSGGPVAYRWTKDGLPIINATNNPLTIPGAQLGSAGDYQVICSNSVTVVTSQVARLDVAADLTNPRALSAVAGEFGNDRVLVRYSELMLFSGNNSFLSVRNPTNYTITRLGGSIPIVITNVAYSPAIGSLLQLDSSDTNWIPSGNYLLTINNVADARSNSIAPGTQLPILWNHTTNLLQVPHQWEFHNSAVFDSDVFEEDWTACDYQPGPWWTSGMAPFYGVFSASACTTLGAPTTLLDWQPEPTLFRTTFNYPSHWPATAILRLRVSVDDALVLYLNGREIYRTNATGTPGLQLTTASRATTAIGTPTCITNIALTITNFLHGTNCFAAALLQSAAIDSDLYFVLEADATAPLGPGLPPAPEPNLSIGTSTADNLRLSWTSGGYILESSTNLHSGPLSHPYGPWTPVPQLANPYEWPVTNGESRFFRLRK